MYVKKDMKLLEFKFEHTSYCHAVVRYNVIQESNGKWKHDITTPLGLNYTRYTIPSNTNTKHVTVK